MLFDEATFRADIGCSILAGQIAVCRFGPQQVNSLVVVAQTYDKLIVYELESDQNSSTDDKNEDNSSQKAEASVQHSIAIREDVVLAVSTISWDESLPITRTDLLLIGCANSVIFYDAFEQTSLLSLNTSTPMSIFVPNQIAPLSSLETSQTSSNDLILCGGSQRMYAIRLSKPTIFERQTSNYLRAEISSERSSSDKILCMASGYFNSSTRLILVGSAEHKVRAHELDLYDFNIQPSKLQIDESAPVTCLCPIYTVTKTTTNEVSKSDEIASSKLSVASDKRSTRLPDIKQTSPTQQKDDSTHPSSERMDHFAYGLENGFIGVYRLFSAKPEASELINKDGINQNTGRQLAAERLWRQRCKQVPVSMLMHDVNGDGFDELVIGYKNGRLESRSPFTGQMLAVTRCFRSMDLSDGCYLAGLSLIESMSDTNTLTTTLLASSSSGQLVGYKSIRSKPRLALHSYAQNESDPIAGNSIATPDKSNQQPEDWTTLFGAAYDPSMDKLSAGISDDGRRQLPVGATTTPTEASTDLHIESRGDATKPIGCHAKQSKQLLQRLTGLMNEQKELEKKACQIYHTTLSQASEINDSMLPASVSIGYTWSSEKTESQTKYIHLIRPVGSDRWHCKTKQQIQLKLTIIVSTLIEQVRLVELVDESELYLRGGHLILNPSSGSTDNRLHDANRFSASSHDRSNEKTKSYFVVVPLNWCSKLQSACIRLRVYCEAIDSRSWPVVGGKADTNDSQANLKLVVRRIHERLVEVPKFSAFVFTTEQCSSTGKLDLNETLQVSKGASSLKMSFKLDDRKQLAKTLEWFNENFLCFRFGQFLNLDQQVNHLADATVLGGGYSVAQNAFALQHQQLLPLHPKLAEFLGFGTDKIGAAPFKFELIHLNGCTLSPSCNTYNTNELQPASSLDNATLIHQQKSGPDSKAKKQATNATSGMLRVAFGPLSDGRMDSASNYLSIECDSADLMSELVRSLVIDRLHFELSVDKFQRGELVADCTSLLDELDSINNESKQLEDTEQRIQAELYEFAEHTGNLMQQFAIAIHLDEFATARDLLNEVSMMLVGAQNAARAHSLNKKTRLRLQAQANGLKKEINFLTGVEKGP